MVCCRDDFRGHFVDPQQLFSPTWGFGVSTLGLDDPISFQIGAVALIFAVLGFLWTWRSAGRLRWELGYFVVAGVGATLLAMQVAAPLWELPVVGGILQSAQFPWRWLVLTALCVSVLSGPIGNTVGAENRDRLTLPLVVLASLVILGSYAYLRVEITEPVEGPVNLAGLIRFQQSSDEMTGQHGMGEAIPTRSPMADYYMNQDNAGEPVKPIDTKLDYGVFDYKTFSASSVAHNTVSEEIYYYNSRKTPRPLSSITSTTRVGMPIFLTGNMGSVSARFRSHRKPRGRWDA